VYSTAALKWNRKIQCGNSCRRINLPLCLQYIRACQQQFFNKSQLSTKSDVFYRPVLCCLKQFFFILLSSISKDALPRYSRVSYKKLNENLVTDSLQTSSLPPWRGKVIWSFAMPLWCNKHLPGQSASIIIAFEFFHMFVSTRIAYPQRFFGGEEKLCLFSK